MTPDTACRSSSRGDAACSAVSFLRTQPRDSDTEAEQLACDLAALMQLGLVELLADGGGELRVEASDDY